MEGKEASQLVTDYIVIIDKLFKLKFNNFNNIHHHPSSLAQIIRTNASFEHLFLLHCSGSSFAVVFLPFSLQNNRPFPVRETLYVIAFSIIMTFFFQATFIANPLLICNSSGLSLAVTSLLKKPFNIVTLL